MANNKLNQFKSRKAQRAEVKSYNDINNYANNKTLEAVYDGTIGLNQLLRINKKTIDMNKCEQPIRLLQKIYNAGSDVGRVTVRGQNMYMADVTIPEVFEEF